ncbi:MAG: T9SS type A sorting domain-containing protein [Bacteroidetes bacterium]|nr:T9SS type A sorting domain-containing protein [Bacteroidota bacterium]
MKKTILLSVSFSVLSILAFAQSPQFAWAHQTNSNGNPDASNTGGIVADTVNDYIYSFGSFSGGGIDFGAGELSGDGGSKNPYLAKYNPNGSLVWARSYYNVSDTYATGVATDHSGNIFITGYSISDTIRFGNQYLLNSTPNDLDHAVAYIAKLDANGNTIWLKGSTGGGSVLSNAVTVDPSGNAYIAGYVFDNTGSFLSHTMVGGLFVMKLDAAGNALWFSQNDPASLQSPAGANSIAIDYAGNCVVNGWYVTDITFGTNTVLHSVGNSLNDRLVLKINGSTGAFIWAFGSGIWQGPDENYDIAVDAQNNIYMSGSLSYATQGPNTSTYVKQQFVEKLNASGASQWINTYKETLSPFNSLVADKYGNTYTALMISDTTAYGTYTVQPHLPFGAGTTLVIVLLKINNVGLEQFAKATASPGPFSIAQVASIAMDLGGYLYINGSIYSNCQFDSYNLNTGNNTEAFVAKIGSSATTGIQDFEQDNTFALYPNPAYSMVYLKNAGEGCSVSILDLSGRTVHYSIMASGSKSIDVSGIPAGVYMVEINANGFRHHQKLAIEH